MGHVREDFSGEDLLIGDIPFYFSCMAGCSFDSSVRSLTRGVSVANYSTLSEKVSSSVFSVDPSAFSSAPIVPTCILAYT